MMNNSTTVQLICILIGDDLKIHGSSFTITVLSEEDFGGVINYMKEATPSVRDKDHGNFRFYKPLLDNPISVSQSLHGFPLTREYLRLRSALLITCKVSEEFQEKDADCHFNIDVIIHVDSGEHGGVTCHLSMESSNSLLRHVKFCLRNCNEVQLLPEAWLFDNNISELPIDEALPDFVQQLEQELCLQCSPKHDMIMLPLLDSVKMLLGDNIFPKYFTDMNDESKTCHVTAIELVHYIDILLDQHLSNQEAYRDKSVSHIYSLLHAKFQFDVPWPLSLTAEIIQDDTLYQYTPCSSFSISIKRFLFLLLGVSSSTSQTEGCYFPATMLTIRVALPSIDRHFPLSWLMGRWAFAQSSWSVMVASPPWSPPLPHCCCCCWCCGRGCIGRFVIDGKVGGARGLDLSRTRPQLAITGRVWKTLFQSGGFSCSTFKTNLPRQTPTSARPVPNTTAALPTTAMTQQAAAVMRVKSHPCQVPTKWINADDGNANNGDTNNGNVNNSDANDSNANDSNTNDSNTNDSNANDCCNATTSISPTWTTKGRS
ncbi:hypothetical protein EDB89DRAFT_1907733 [Lactarius sanguifluus]|nr:hypothetical protein EDB89DRAFT_1907733 [Lactarius sanguifluus]